MSFSVNHTTLGGNLTRDPEIRYVGSGSAVCKATIAVNHGKKGSEETTFVDIVAWEKTAETLNTYFKKGKPILIEGRLSIRNYETKEGEKRKATEVVIGRIHFLPRNAGDDNDDRGYQRSNSRDGGGYGDPLEDEIPF